MKKQSNVAVKWSYIAIQIIAMLGLSACATSQHGGIGQGSLPFYRCEHGIEFTAKFVGESVALDSSRGYDVLFAATKAAQDNKEYSNPRMAASFGLGTSGQEAQLRYPLLPLIARCVRDH